MSRVIELADWLESPQCGLLGDERVQEAAKLLRLCSQQKMEMGMSEANQQLERFPEELRMRKELDELRRELAAKQAQIDRLMLEFCPDEMTQDQISEWKRHQKVVQE